jgi:hypothetical protein
VILLLVAVTRIESKHKERRNYTEIATNEELEEISQELFDLSNDSLLSYITLNLQGRHATFNSTEDLAPEP